MKAIFIQSATLRRHCNVYFKVLKVTNTRNVKMVHTLKVINFESVCKRATLLPKRPRPEQDLAFPLSFSYLNPPFYEFFLSGSFSFLFSYTFLTFSFLFTYPHCSTFSHNDQIKYCTGKSLRSSSDIQKRPGCTATSNFNCLACMLYR